MNSIATITQGSAIALAGKNVTKVFRTRDGENHALGPIDFDIQEANSCRSSAPRAAARARRC